LLSSALLEPFLQGYHPSQLSYDEYAWAQKNFFFLVGLPLSVYTRISPHRHAKRACERKIRVRAGRKFPKTLCPFVRMIACLGGSGPQGLIISRNMISISCLCASVQCGAVARAHLHRQIPSWERKSAIFVGRAMNGIVPGVWRNARRNWLRNCG
jgi:hypothetical protein